MMALQAESHLVRSLPADSLDMALRNFVSAETQKEKDETLRKVSRKFYAFCFHAGMKRVEILSLATEIIDCFSEDIKSLREKADDT